MPRVPRVIVAGGWYHVCARGMEGRSIFRDDRDRCHFLELVGEVVERFRLRAHAYVLMENHYHLLLELGEGNLARAIQWLNLSYGVWFNRRHGRAGYLFQGRYKGTLVEPAAWGVAVSAYIHLNPARVRALGLSKAERRRAEVWRVEAPSLEVIAERLKVARGYRWSSYGAYLKAGKGPAWLEVETVLGLIGGRKEERRENYRKFVENQLREGTPAPAELEEAGRVVLGGREFVEKIFAGVARAAKAMGGAGRQPRLPKWARRTVGFEDVIRALEETRGERWEDFRDRHGDRGRDMALLLGRRATTLTLAELAKQAGLEGPAQAAVAIKRTEARFAQDRALRKTAESAARKLGVEL